MREKNYLSFFMTTIISAVSLSACLQSKTGNQNPNAGSKKPSAVAPVTVDDDNGPASTCGGAGQVACEDLPQNHVDKYEAHGADADGLEDLKEATRFQVEAVKSVYCAPYNSTNRGFSIAQTTPLIVNHLGPSVSEQESEDLALTEYINLVQAGATTRLPMQFIDKIPVTVPGNASTSLYQTLEKSFFGKRISNANPNIYSYALWGADKGAPAPVKESAHKYYLPKYSKVISAGGSSEPYVGLATVEFQINIDSSKTLAQQSYSALVIRSGPNSRIIYYARCAFKSQ